MGAGIGDEKRVVDKEGTRVGENDRLKSNVNVGSMDSLMDGPIEGPLASVLLGRVVMEEAGGGGSNAINDGEEVMEGAGIGDWLPETFEWTSIGWRVSTSDGAALRFEAPTMDEASGDDDVKFDGTTVGAMKSSLDGVTLGDDDSATLG